MEIFHQIMNHRFFVSNRQPHRNPGSHLLWVVFIFGVSSCMDPSFYEDPVDSNTLDAISETSTEDSSIDESQGSGDSNGESSAGDASGEAIQSDADP